jgi:hypothetical protein
MTRTRLFLSSIAIAIVAALGQSLADEEKGRPRLANTIEIKTADDTAEWSKSVNGLQARISFKHMSVANGSPRVATYLHLRNTAGVNDPIKFYWRPEKATYRAIDAAGKAVPVRGLEYSGPGPMEADLIIPYEGTLSFNISGQGLGIPGDMAAVLDLGVNSCIIYPEDGPCFLQAAIEIADDKKRDSPRSWHGRLELPPVAIPLKVEQPDPATVEALIQKLGQEMVGGNGTESEKARRELSLIVDERVVPWYAKAIETNSYELKFAALDRLSKFKSDEAFIALKKGMTTQGADIANCSTAALAAQSAASVRLATANAFARSPHPDAISQLLTMWNDPYPEIRISVLHALGKMNTDDSLALLRKMSKDSDERVRTEARRYLELQSLKP